jgi:glutathione S-transferase
VRQDHAAPERRERAECRTPYLLGESISHADVALAVVVHFLRQAVPAALEHLALPALLAHEALCQARPEFQAIDQPLNFPR